MKIVRVSVLIITVLLISSGYIPDNSRKSTSVSYYNAAIESFTSTFFSMIRCEVSKPDYEVFKEAFTGFLNLKAGNNIKKNILTIIDFSLSSTTDRMWVIDLNKLEVVHLSLVAHGHNSGGEFASHFSNSPSSHKSSLGFFLTGGTYFGKHGMSLILEGAEPGINDKAKERALVMHGADYVSRGFIRANGRLGRSFGCPSIPLEDHEKIITMLSGRSCIYIHYPDYDYRNNSHMFAGETATKGMNLLFGELSGIFKPLSGINLIP